MEIETKQAELLLEAGAVEVVAAPKTKKKPTNPETELDAE